MEWREVPGYPGYQVSERGRLRKSSGYELARRGPRFVLSRGGVLTRLTPAELIALAWPPSAPQQSVPAQEARAPESVPVEPEAPAIPAAPTPSKTAGSKIPEGFVPVPGSGGYHINRAGELINSRGKRLRLQRHNYYSLGNSKVSVSRLLDLTFGAGSAVAAGYTEPRPVDTGRQKRAATQDYGTHCKRRCHDCGCPTTNYRCDACWHLLRGGGDMEESEWNAL